MTLSKKKSRRITVDDQNYRWAPSIDSGYYVLVVQNGGGAGRRLEIVISIDDNILIEDGYSIESGDTDAVIITPRLVAGFIREAKGLGWNPQALGPPVELTAKGKNLIIRRGL